MKKLLGLLFVALMVASVGCFGGGDNGDNADYDDFYAIPIGLGELKNGTVDLCYDGQPFFNANHPVGTGVVSNIDSAGGGDYWYLLDTRNVIKPIVFQMRQDYEFVEKT